MATVERGGVPSVLQVPHTPHREKLLSTLRDEQRQRKGVLR